MKKVKKITPYEAMEDLTKSAHAVTFHTALAMIRKFKLFRSRVLRTQAVVPFYFPLFPDCISYNKAAISNLLAQDGCCGIRIYPGDQ